MPPIPPPQAEGYTSTTPVPLYWCRYAPRAPKGRMVVLHGGPGADHRYLLPQLAELARMGEKSAQNLVAALERGQPQRSEALGGLTVRDLTAEEKARMVQAEDCGEIVAFLARMPTHVCINELTVSPTWNRSYAPQALAVQKL